jgi:hypothetical protein
MAPSATDPQPPVVSKRALRQPLELSGALNSYESFDVTPVIGKEFPTANLVDWLDAPNSDELLRDLAITSEFSCHNPLHWCADTNDAPQSPSEAWCSSGRRMA